MAQPSLKPADIKRTVRLVESLLRKGHRARGRKGGTPRPTAITAAAKIAEENGWAKRGRGEWYIRHRLRVAESMGNGPDWTISPPVKVAPRPRNVAAEIVAAGPRSYTASVRPVRVMVIPDVHLCPTHPNLDRMEWLGRWARDLAPDWIVQLGDLGTFDSVNRHAAPGTLAAEKNPRILADFDILARGLDVFEKASGGVKARRIVTKGNHEYRLDRFEDLNPAAQGMFAGRFDEICNAHGWAVKPYRAYHFIEGVGFIHHPVNTMGKPIGGKTGPQRTANDSTFSIVHGHTHSRQSVVAAKFNHESVRVISAGCALPQGHIEEYAQHNQTGWWWGAACLTIQRGEIMDEEWRSMRTLESRYRARRTPNVR